MDIRTSMTNVDRSLISGGQAAAQRARATVEQQSLDIAKKAGASVDTGATQRLVESGQSEAMALHEAEIQQIATDIRTGSYSADLDVVAMRVAQVLGL